MVVMMFGYGGGWAWWQAGLMWLAMIGFLVLLIWAVYGLITGITRQERGPNQRERSGSARRILDERLARGEIDAGEYRRLREVLNGGPGRSGAGAER
jgi:putative membrane protein